MNILLIEDIPEITSAFTMILEKDGHRVFVAANQEDSFTILENGNIELILLDIGLPGIKGDELSRSIRNRAYKGRLVITTNMTSGYDQNMLKAANVETIVLKSKIGPQELRDIVDGRYTTS